VTTPAERDTLSIWQVVELARHQDRPYSMDYIKRLAPDFVELHGDRVSHDDPAVVAGVGTWRDMTVVFLGQQKGRNLSERVARNWGMMHPEGFRKALRLGRQAAKFGFPVISLVDTPGAYPGESAEERGVASRSRWLAGTRRVPPLASEKSSSIQAILATTGRGVQKPT